MFRWTTVQPTKYLADKSPFFAFSVYILKNENFDEFEIDGHADLLGVTDLLGIIANLIKFANGFNNNDACLI